MFADALRRACCSGGGGAVVAVLAAGSSPAGCCVRSPTCGEQPADLDGDYDLSPSRGSQSWPLSPPTSTRWPTLERPRPTSATAQRGRPRDAHPAHRPDGRVEGLVDGVFAVDQDLMGELSDELARLQRLADDLLSSPAWRRVGSTCVRVDSVGWSTTLGRWRASCRDEIDRGRHPAPVAVRGDGPAAQVLDNLVGNAIRAVSGRGRS